MDRIARLKTELAVDHPITGPYDADDQLAANELNAINRKRNKTAMSGDELFAATDSGQFDSLTNAKKQMWLAFCGRDQINPFGAANVAFVEYLFGVSNTATMTNLAAARVVNVSRAIEIGVPFAHAGDVGEARKP